MGTRIHLHVAQVLHVNTDNTCYSLVPRPSQKAERGSGVLNEFSCHMGRGQMV